LYESPEQGYSFRYIKTWKIDTQGSLTVLTDPAKPNVTKTATGLEKLGQSDVAISTVLYAGIIITTPGITYIGPTFAPHDQQVEDLATQLAFGNKILPTTVNGLAGYVAVTTKEGGSTYNILLQGSKNMLLIQLIGKKSRLELNRGQSIVLESIVEL